MLSNTATLSEKARLLCVQLLLEGRWGIVMLQAVVLWVVWARSASLLQLAAFLAGLVALGLNLSRGLGIYSAAVTSFLDQALAGSSLPVTPGRRCGHPRHLLGAIT